MNRKNNMKKNMKINSLKNPNINRYKYTNIYSCKCEIKRVLIYSYVNKLAILIAFIFVFKSELNASDFLKNKKNFTVIIEPKYYGSETSRPFGLSKKTVILPAHYQKNTIEKFSGERFLSLGIGWKEYLEIVKSNAELLMKKVKPNIVRAKNETIMFAEIKNVDHRLCSVILSSTFYEKFKKIFGKKFYVSIPERGTIIAIPIGLSKQDMDFVSIRISMIYDSSIYPVTNEIFKFNGNSIVVAGKFRTTKS